MWENKEHEERGERRWTFSTERVGDRTEYVLRAGEEIVGRAGSQVDAEFICHARTEIARQAARLAFCLRKHRLEVNAMRNEVDMLRATLHRMTAAVKRGRFREITTAREEASRLLRRLGNHR